MFWDDLMRETGVATGGWGVPTATAYDFLELVPCVPFPDDLMEEPAVDYNVGDVIVGEIVEEQGELTTGEKAASL